MTKKEAKIVIEELGVVKRTYDGILDAKEALKEIPKMTNPVDLCVFIPTKLLRELAMRYCQEEVEKYENKLSETNGIATPC